jgi:MFS transporter, CP family, cyanate transporter
MASDANDSLSASPTRAVEPRLAGLAALFVVAFALRPQIVGLGPLLPAVQDDLSMSHGVTGLVATIPVLCMGVFAPIAPVVTARLGTRRAVAASLVVIAVCGLARAVAWGPVSLLAFTLGIGIGIGVAGAILPVAVKERFPHRPATATGVYAAGIQLGAAVSAAAAVPLASRWDTWRAAAVVFSIAAAASAALWWAAVRGGRPTGAPQPRVRLPWRSTTAWFLVAVFALQGVPYYGLNAWLPAYLREIGWGATAAGGALAIFNVAALTSTLTVPRLADVWGSRRLYLLAGAIGATVAIAGLLLLPAAAVLWVAIVGVALGQLFALALTLPLDVSDTPREVAATAGLMLGAGYGLAAVTPYVLGAMRDVSEGFEGGLWLLVGVGVLTIAVTALLSPERLRRGL